MEYVSNTNGADVDDYLLGKNKIVRCQEKQRQ